MDSYIILQDYICYDIVTFGIFYPKLYQEGVHTKLYHFTSLENWGKILKSERIEPMSLYNGKYITWLTKNKEKRHQYWAIGEHKDKTEIRIAVSTLNFSRLKLPENPEEKQEFFRMGAVETKLWEKETRNHLDKPISEDHMNWYLSEVKLMIHKVDVFSPIVRKYVFFPTITAEEEREFVIEQLRIYGDTYWYRRRWNEYYREKYDIK